VPASAPVTITAGGGAFDGRGPNKGSPPLKDALKKNELGGPGLFSLPKASAVRPEVWGGLPLALSILARSAPVVGFNSFAGPSPWLPIRMALRNGPKPPGARTAATGALSGPFDAKRCNRWPPVSKTSTNPDPGAVLWRVASWAA